VVFEAWHLGLERGVALKILRSEHAGDCEIRQRFLREARTTAMLKTEHVVAVLDADALEPSSAYIAMELLEGRDLAAIVAEDGALPVSTAVSYVIDVCNAVSEAHSLGIIHRDIKPSNLFLARGDGDGPLLKVLDFGLSRIDTASGALTSENRILGSPQFMAPEQMRAARDADARSDIWSIGATLFTLLAGQCPFRGAFLTEVCAAVLTGDCVPLREVRPEVPEGLAAVVMRCLCIDPEERFQSAAELAAALSPYQRNATEEALFDAHSEHSDTVRLLPFTRSPELPAPRPSSTRWVAGGVALALGAFGLLATTARLLGVEARLPLGGTEVASDEQIRHTAQHSPPPIRMASAAPPGSGEAVVGLRASGPSGTLNGEQDGALARAVAAPPRNSVVTRSPAPEAALPHKSRRDAPSSKLGRGPLPTPVPTLTDEQLILRLPN
jgi:serine/threonine-protein kinase